MLRLPIWVLSLVSVYGDSLHDVITQEDLPGDEAENTDAQSEQGVTGVSRDSEDLINYSYDEIQIDQLSKLGQDNDMDDISNRQRYG